MGRRRGESLQCVSFVHLSPPNMKAVTGSESIRIGRGDSRQVSPGRPRRPAVCVVCVCAARRRVYVRAREKNGRCEKNRGYIYIDIIDI
jgi:hypothetical protein